MRNLIYDKWYFLAQDVLKTLLQEKIHFCRKGEIMKTSRLIRGMFLAGVTLGVIFLGPITAYSRDTNSGYQIPEGVYIKLSKEFYDAIKNDHSTGTKVYTNDPSIEYLKQIAISTRFLVETNLEILKQQEKMIELLHSLPVNKKK